jgi:xanthine dehydrogenase iron-sulfur cluster and FAD-binding subunit A
MTSFFVNGKPVQVDVDPATPLLWVLRDSLEMTGTKFGCGMALCGACTVHLDGKAIRSCVAPLSRAEGKHVTTIEGLSTNLTHPLQRAWIELDVPSLRTRTSMKRWVEISAAVGPTQESAEPSIEPRNWRVKGGQDERFGSGRAAGIY